MRVWVDITDAAHVVFFAPIVRRLADATSNVLDLPWVRDRLEGLGLDVVLRRAAPGPRLVRRVRREGASRRQVGQGLGQAVGRGGRAVREVRMDEFFF